MFPPPLKNLPIPLAVKATQDLEDAEIDSIFESILTMDFETGSIDDKNTVSIYLFANATPSKRSLHIDSLVDEDYPWQERNSIPVTQQAASFGNGPDR